MAQPQLTRPPADEARDRPSPAARRPAARPVPPPPADAPVWHALPPAEVLATLDTPPAGLSAAEAAARLAREGPNVLAAAAGESVWALLWRQLRSPLILVLIGAGALAIALGKGVDGLVVLGVVVLNTLVGFVQEWKAGRAIQSLGSMVAEGARVRRDGLVTTVPAADLVPGDIVVFEAGDRVSADVRLTTVRGLETTEAALTGESLPVAKAVAPVAADAGIGDRGSMAYGGTLVTAGAGEGVVVATAGRTELGRIAALLDHAAPGETPLVRALARVARTLTIVIIVVAVLLAGVALLRGYPVGDAVLAAITLAVAAIPEGLPAIVTIALAVGVQRMARRRAVVRHLPAVETLGSTTVICSDKTGTLTRNEMTVQALWTPTAGAWRVEGVGYAPEGALAPDAEDAARDGAPAADPGDPTGAGHAVRALLGAGTLCADARLVGGADVEGGWRIDGDPTEGALVVAARKAGLDADGLRREWPRVDVVPFDSARQWMATRHEAPFGGTVVCVKGAPEAVLARVAVDQAGRPVDRAAMLARVEGLARRGMRVLAVAERREEGDADRAPLDADAFPDDLTLLGVAGMIDPPRPEVVAAVATCHRAGIAVAMITGDHRATAEAIGAELGLPQGPGSTPEAAVAVTGAELAALDDDALRPVARARRVFARVSPEQKLRLVRALQAEGQVVAMTGDGVNDAPALRQADIGVAMGITGTAVSREAADVVLTDDDFATIGAAVEEGRRVYDNLVKSLAFALPTNLGEALIILAAVVAFPVVNGQPLLPMQPVQILWINLVATVTLALPLALEAREPDVMRRPPRAPDTPLLDGFVLWRTAAVALLMAAAALALFLWELRGARAGGVPEAAAVRAAQTAAVTAVVLMQIVYVMACRSLAGPVRAIGWFSNPWIYAGIALLLALQLAFVYLAPLQRVFGTTGLDGAAWLRAAGMALLVLPLTTADKAWRTRRARRAPPPAGAR